MKTTIAILLSLLFFTENSKDYLSVSSKYENWNLEKDKNGIKVYTRQSQESTIKEFKAITIVKATVPQLVAILNDVDSYPQWMPNLKFSKTLKQLSSKERYDYYEASLPWPMSNRDIVLHYKLNEDVNTKVVKITLIGKPDYIPEKPGIIRIPKEKGMWQFTPLENGETEIIYQELADPGGKLPDWVINMFVVDTPYNILVNLKERV